MTNEKRKLSIITGLLMSFFILVGIGNEVYAAQVGQTLPEPEEGWERYDDRDVNVSYEGSWSTSILTGNYYNKTYNVTPSSSQSVVRFNFIGSKIRIIGRQAVDRADSIMIKIDGNIVEEFTQKNKKTIEISLDFEKSNLSYGEHYVEITGITEGVYVLDAIDIDENGELLPYNPHINNNSDIVLDIEPEKEKIKITEEVYADLTIDNIKEIAAEDIRIQYDNEKLDFLGFEEIDGIKLIKSIEDVGNGQLRVILASKGEDNIVNIKETLLRLKFKGKSIGKAKVDIIKARVSDGIEMEKDLIDKQCDEGIIVIEDINDVNNSGEFTLLDLAIDARHLSKDPNSLPQYNADIVKNGAIDEDDLLEIARLMIENPNYVPNIRE